MKSSIKNRRKVVVVGAGAVGSTFCYALAQNGLADEIVLIDKNEDLAHGQVLDLVHGQPFFPTVSIRQGDPADYGDAGLIVLTASAPQKPGETRLQLLKKNAAIVRAVLSDIVNHNSQAILLVVSNPVDVMTQVALSHTGWDRGRVIGSGTVLDSARLRHILSTHCGIDVHNVHGYVLGEHGDSEFVAWSMTNVAGMQIDSYCSTHGNCSEWGNERGRIEQQVRDSAYHIIDYKGATYFAVGLALVRMASAILRGQKSVLTISTFLDGEFGLNDVCLSVPSVVSEQGVKKIIEPRLPEHEYEALTTSARIIKQSFGELEA